jgi:hypothetical protein
VRLPVTPADVRRVELLRVSTGREGDVVPGTSLGSVTGADAVAIVQLVADLPDDGMMRCFSPVYGLEVHGAAGLLVKLAFCFRCHNAGVAVPGGDRRELIGFDPASPAGQELLARFKAADQARGEKAADRPGN